MTFAIGKAGAVNAAVASLQILALSDAEKRKTLIGFRERQTQEVLSAKFED